MMNKKILPASVPKPLRPSLNANMLSAGIASIAYLARLTSVPNTCSNVSGQKRVGRSRLKPKVRKRGVAQGQQPRMRCDSGPTGGHINKLRNLQALKAIE